MGEGTEDNRVGREDLEVRVEFLILLARDEVELCRAGSRRESGARPRCIQCYLQIEAHLASATRPPALDTHNRLLARSCCIQSMFSCLRGFLFVLSTSMDRGLVLISRETVMSPIVRFVVMPRHSGIKPGLIQMQNGCKYSRYLASL